MRRGALRDRLVLVDPAARTVEAEALQHVLCDREVADEFADVGLGTDGNGYRHGKALFDETSALHCPDLVPRAHADGCARSDGARAGTGHDPAGRNYGRSGG